MQISSKLFEIRMRNAVTFLVIFISLKIDASPFGFKAQDNDALPFECQFIKLPEAIETFYDEILSNPGTQGQNLSLIRDTIAEDWNTRPNPLNPSMGISAGPFPGGLQKSRPICSFQESMNIHLQKF